MERGQINFMNLSWFSLPFPGTEHTQTDTKSWLLVSVKLQSSYNESMINTVMYLKHLLLIWYT